MLVIIVNDELFRPAASVQELEFKTADQAFQAVLATQEDR